MDLIQAIRPIKPAPTSAEQAADKRFMLYGYEPSDPAGQETVLSLWDQSNRVLEDFVRDQNRSASHMDSGILAANTFNDPRINLRTSGLRTPPTESTLSLSHHSVLKSPSRTRTRQAAKSSLSKPGVKQPRGRPRLNISAADIIDVRCRVICCELSTHFYLETADADPVEPEKSPAEERRFDRVVTTRKSATEGSCY